MVTGQEEPVMLMIMIPQLVKDTIQKHTES